MNNKRKIEIFSAGCSVCDETIAMVNEVACEFCEIEVLNMQQADIAAKAKAYGVISVPAIVVDGKLAACCTGRGVDIDNLRLAGVGIPLAD